MEPSSNHAIPHPSSHPLLSFRGTPLHMDALDFFPQKTKEIQDHDHTHHHQTLHYHVDVCIYIYLLLYIYIYIHANSCFFGF